MYKVFPQNLYSKECHMCNKTVGIDVTSQEALSINKPVY